MNEQKSKLLRKIARLSGRTDTYIKSEYKKMSPDMQKQYLAFMKENLKQIEELKKNPPEAPIILDTKLREEA